jgi:putative addiction module component (TIGR02574 family)
MEISFNQILSLSIAERILLVEAIWDSIASEKESGNTYKLNEGQMKILEEEVAAYSKNPEEGISWGDLKKKIAKQ